MTFDNIIPFIMGYIPLIVAVFGEIAAFVVTMKKYKDHTLEFKALVEVVKDQSKYEAYIEEIKAQYIVVMHENAELKRQLAEAIAKMDKVKIVTPKE